MAPSSPQPPKKQKVGASPEAQLMKLTLPVLKKKLVELGLPTDGLKKDIVARLASVLPPDDTFLE